MRDIHSVYMSPSASGDFHWPGQIHAKISVALAVGGLVPAIYDDPAPRHLSLGRIFVASCEVRYDAVAYAEALVQTVLQFPVAAVGPHELPVGIVRVYSSSPQSGLEQSTVESRCRLNSHVDLAGGVPRLRIEAKTVPPGVCENALNAHGLP